MRKLRMLAACEMSGRVATEFAKRGWEAWSADLLPSEAFADGDNQDLYLNGGVYRHYQGDVRDLFDWYHPVNAHRGLVSGWLWDLVIGFPPCDHLALGGARYWPAKRADGRQDAAARFFMEMVQAPAPYVAVENPRGDMTRRYRAPDQYIQPWWFGDPLAKATGLWLKNLPPLAPEYRREDFAELKRVATGGGSYRTDKRRTGLANNGHEDGEGRAMRTIVRSRTSLEVARAMAAQWGSYIEQEKAA